MNLTLPMNNLKGLADEDSLKFSISPLTKLYSKMAAPKIIITNSKVDNTAETALLLLIIYARSCP